MMDPVAAILVEGALKVAVIVAAGWAGAAVARRAPAAWRYQIWFGAGLAILVAPVISGTASGWHLPRWELVSAARLSRNVTPVAAVVRPGEAARKVARAEKIALPPIWSLDEFLVGVLLFGSAAQLLRLAGEIWFWRRCRRRAVPPDEGERARLDPLREGMRVGYSDRVVVPVLAGWRRPMILLPLTARTWPDSTLRAAVRHEVAHYRRGDHWGQWLPAALGVLYWWHPGVWLVVRQLRVAREAACDDAVLRAGCRASDYADALMQVVRAARGQRIRSRLAVTMASGSRVSSRVEAVLARDRDRRAVGWAVGGVVLVVALAIAGIVGAARLAAPSGTNGRPPSSRPAKLPTANGADTIEVVEVTARFLEVGDADYVARKNEFDRWVHAANLRAFENLPGSRLLSAPSTMVRSGQGSRIEVGREFRYPVAFERAAGLPITPVRFQTENLGLMFDFTAERVGDDVQVHGVATMRAFEGFTEGDEGVRVPTFLTKEVNIFRVIPSGRMVGFWLPGMGVRGVQPENGGDPTAASSDSGTSRMAIFLGAAIRFIPKPPGSPAKRSAKPTAGNPRSAPSTPTPAAAPAGELPFGAPLAGKPGFVTSPYVPPDRGMVDVRGFPPNTEVKCPYSGKIFLVP